jgi:hypothetical protein
MQDESAACPSPSTRASGCARACLHRGLLPPASSGVNLCLEALYSACVHVTSMRTCTAQACTPPARAPPGPSHLACRRQSQHTHVRLSGLPPAVRLSGLPPAVRLSSLPPAVRLPIDALHSRLCGHHGWNVREDGGGRPILKRTHTHTLTHTLSILKRTQTHTLAQTDTLSHRHTHTHSLSQTHTLTDRQTLSLTDRQTHTLSLTHTLTDRHRQTRIRP